MVGLFIMLPAACKSAPRIPDAIPLVDPLEVANFTVWWPPENLIEPGQVWAETADQSTAPGVSKVLVLNRPAEAVSTDEAHPSYIKVKAGAWYSFDADVGVKADGGKVNGEAAAGGAGSARVFVKFEALRVVRVALGGLLETLDAEKLKTDRFRSPAILQAVLQVRSGVIEGSEEAISRVRAKVRGGPLDVSAGGSTGAGQWRRLEIGVDWMTIGVQFVPLTVVSPPSPANNSVELVKHFYEKWKGLFMDNLPAIASWKSGGHKVPDDIYDNLAGLVRNEVLFCKGAALELLMDDRATEALQAGDNGMESVAERIDQLRAQGNGEWEKLQAEIGYAITFMKLRDNWWRSRIDEAMGIGAKKCIVVPSKPPK